MNRAKFIGLAVGAIAVGALVLVAGNGAFGATVKIGVVVPLSGAGSVFGEAARSAILMAEQDLGETKNKYKIIFEDSASNIGVAAAAVRKLVEEDSYALGIDADNLVFLLPLSEKQLSAFPGCREELDKIDKLISAETK